MLAKASEDRTINYKIYGAGAQKNPTYAPFEMLNFLKTQAPRPHDQTPTRPDRHQTSATSRPCPARQDCRTRPQRPGHEVTAQVCSACNSRSTRLSLRIKSSLAPGGHALLTVSWRQAPGSSNASGPASWHATGTSRHHAAQNLTGQQLCDVCPVRPGPVQKTGRMLCAMPQPLRRPCPCYSCSRQHKSPCHIICPVVTLLLSITHRLSCR